MKRLSVAVAVAFVLTLSASVALAEVSAASPDGKCTATAKDKVITVTDNQTQKEIMSIRGHAADVTGLAYSPDGKRLGSADKDGVVKLFDASTGKELRSIKSGVGGTVSFSPDGKNLAVSSGKQTKKYDVATGKEVK
jgi:WD40 repeat protein